MRLSKPVTLGRISQAGKGKLPALRFPEECAIRASFCCRLRADETSAVKELTAQMSRGLMVDWMKQQGTLSRAHGEHLGQLAPMHLGGVLGEVIERTLADLTSGLEHLSGGEEQGDGTGSGVPGRAAEFLGCQRGIRPQEALCSNRAQQRR